MTPKVSVIIPIYNVEEYLHRCIDSVRTQSLEDIEIILVDDESPDDCPRICDEYSSVDDRIIVIHKKNEGLGFARNSGIESASGEYVYFVDSDDYLNKDALEELYKKAKEDDLDMCFGNICAVNEKGEIVKRVNKFSDKIFRQPEIINEVLTAMLGADPKGKNDVELGMSAWQGLYKLSWLKLNNLRFPSERVYISEDIIFHIDALPQANKMAYIANYVYYHSTYNKTSLTKSYNPERFDKDGVLYLEEMSRVSKFSDNGEMKKRIQRTYLGNVRVCLKQIVGKARNENDKQFAYVEIEKIVNDSIFQQVLKEYPYWKNPIKQAIMSFLLKHRLVFLVYIATKLQNGAN